MMSSSGPDLSGIAKVIGFILIVFGSIIILGRMLGLINPQDATLATGTAISATTHAPTLAVTNTSVALPTSLATTIPTSSNTPQQMPISTPTSVLTDTLVPIIPSPASTNTLTPTLTVEVTQLPPTATP